MATVTLVLNLASTEKNDIILPKWIYIKDGQGRYLSVVNTILVPFRLTFSSGNPDLLCAFETVKSGGSWYKLIGNDGQHVLRYHLPDSSLDAWYSTEIMKIPDNEGNPSFNIIVASVNKVYLKDNFSPALFFSSEDGFPRARNYINEGSRLEIVQAAMKNDIIDVVYDIPGAKVREAPPLIVLSTSVRNDSAGDASQTLSYTYEKWSVGTWNNSAGIEIGAKASFQAGFPFVANAKYEISVSGSYSHEWGGEAGTKQIITSSTSVTVPPKKKARAQIIVRNAQIDVDFTYTQKILWSNGQTELDQKKHGVYNNVDSWHVDVILDSWEDV